MLAKLDPFGTVEADKITYNWLDQFGAWWAFYWCVENSVDTPSGCSPTGKLPPMKRIAAPVIIVK